jgi:hypothetical protein
VNYQVYAVQHAETLAVMVREGSFPAGAGFGADIHCTLLGAYAERAEALFAAQLARRLLSVVRPVLLTWSGDRGTHLIGACLSHAAVRLLMGKRLLLACAFLASALVAVGDGFTVHAASCTPKSKGTCNACKNCRACKHCSKDGGSCSVCK